jgi:hypothetical protein
LFTGISRYILGHRHSGKPQSGGQCDDCFIHGQSD